MAEATYDESGALFNFFLISLMSCILLPVTVFGRSKGNLIADSIMQKRSRVIYLLLSYLILGGLVYRTSVLVHEDVKQWNPFDILGK
jgi:preprotein translocase subunit Sec63